MTVNNKYHSDIILASASPRRKAMFEERGIPVRICPVEVEEDLPMEMSPETSVMYLALKKAMWVADKELTAPTGQREHRDVDRSDSLVIAADTIVVFDGEVIGKPCDEDEAYRVLSAMRGKRHAVITGVCLMDARSIRCLYERTDVYFKNYGDEELRAYLRTDEPYDKARGYAIQGTFGKYIDHIDGDRDNVIGFPMYRVEELLLENTPHI